MKRNRLFLGFKALLLGVGLCYLFSCDRFYSKNETDVLVTVGDERLLREELVSMIPKGTLPKDSLNMAGKIIQHWVAQKVLLKKAKENQVFSDSYWEKQIEDYKNSLLVYAYRNGVLSQYMDTVVSEQEIEVYYNENTSQFYLKSNLVRVRFAKVEKNNRLAAKIKKEMFNTPFTEEHLVVLGRLCEQGAKNYYIDEEQWIFFNDLLREVPIQTYNQEDFLKNHHQIELADDQYLYYLVIVDFKVKDMVSPLKFEKERIRQIILNCRKQEVLERMQMEVMKEAQAKKWIKYE